MSAMYELTGAELDAVSGGQLIEIEIERVANNSLNNNDVTVGIPVQATVVAAVLSGATGAVTSQRGRIT